MGDISIGHLHHGFITRRRFPGTSYSLLAPINPEAYLGNSGQYVPLICYNLSSWKLDTWTLFLFKVKILARQTSEKVDFFAFFDLYS